MQKELAEHDNEFIDALEKAYARLDKMLIEQQKVEKHRLEIDYAVAKLTQKILHLAALCDDVPKELQIDRLKKSIQNLGVTDAVREIIKGAEKPLTVTDVKDRLEQLGVAIDYVNAGAVLHIVFRRLVGNGEIKETPEKGKSKKTYVWIPAKPQTTFTPRPSALGTQTRLLDDDKSK